MARPPTRRKIAGRKARTADLKNISGAILDAWGGVEGFVKSMREDYEKAEPGSVARIRLDTTILKLLQAMPPEIEGGTGDLEALVREAKILVQELGADG